MGLTRRPSGISIRHVSGVADRGIESVEEVVLVLAAGTKYETRLQFPGQHWKEVAPTEAYMVIVSTRAFDACCAFLAPTLQSFAWYPGWSRMDTRECVRIPLHRDNPQSLGRPPEVRPVASATQRPGQPILLEGMSFRPTFTCMTVLTTDSPARLSSALA